MAYWRYEYANRKVNETNTPSQNYTVLAGQRRVGQRSNIGVIFVNRTNIGSIPTGGDGVENPIASYNRNAGLEYNLASSNGKWTGKAFYVKSFSPIVSNESAVHAANIKYLGEI